MSNHLMPFGKQELNRLHRQIETPALVISAERLERNLRTMQQIADQNGCALRPHTKTHKSPDFARRQIELGAKGITVAKLSEAETMRQAGIDDIFIANQITQPLKFARLRKLHQSSRIIVGLDSVQQIKLLEKEFAPGPKPLKVRIEIDSGLKRCGVTVGQGLVELARKVARRPWLELEGIFTHAGQVYRAQSWQEAEQIGRQEAETMSRAKRLLEENGIAIRTVSVGSTPTAPFSAAHPDVNEIRPGNYIFLDAMQMHIHGVPAERCSLFVLATTVSQPEPDRLIIDAGSKALHTDGAALTGHYGVVVNLPATIDRLSEEHGVLALRSEQPVPPGQPVLIIPNHACVVANLFDRYHLVDERLRIQTVPVSARGKSQ